MGLILLFCNYYSFTANGFEQFSKTDSPYGRPYYDWVANWWNWTLSIPTDEETDRFSGLSDNGCLIHDEGSVVMLVDTAAGGYITQKCEIPSNKAIFLTIWTGVCNTQDTDIKNATSKGLSECARKQDLGRIYGEVKIDNIPVGKVDVTDYTTNLIENITEIYTNQFNLTLPEDSHGVVPKVGTFPAVAHGWFVFLKPLPPGEHTIFYKNSVEESDQLSGAENTNAAEITYHVTVK